MPEDAVLNDTPGDYSEFLDGFLEKLLGVSLEHDITLDDSNPRVIAGMEVGDDREDITRSTLIACSVLTAQEEVTNMRTSEDDTWISEDKWNLAEVSTIVPTSPLQTFGTCRKTGGFDELQFIDTPPLRVIVDTTKAENRHSSSTPGKASLLGSKLKTSNSKCRAYLQIANVLQDGFLNTPKSTEPKYLPSILGGSNCPASYEDPYNTYLYMKAFKGGRYDRLYGTATAEIKEAIRLTESGKPTTAIIPKLLRDNHEYAFGTFANYLLLPADIIHDIRGTELPVPLYRAMGVKNNVASFESRLRRTRHLVTRSEAQVLNNRKQRILNSILSNLSLEKEKEKETIRKERLQSELNGAIHGNSAFMNLVDKQGSMNDVLTLLSENWDMCTTGQPEFSYENAKWLHNGGKGDFLSIVDIPLDEDVFLREEVSLDESMKVEGITLNVEGRKKFLPQTTKAQVGLYEINQEMMEWADRHVDALKSHPVRPIPQSDVITYFSRDREWVNDDTCLIQQALIDTAGCGETTQLALVTRDHRLANQMAKQTNCEVVMISPTSVAEAFPNKKWNSTSELTNQEVFDAYPYSKYRNNLRIPYKTYIDTGALHADLVNKDIVKSTGLQYNIVSDAYEKSGWNSGYRTHTFTRTINPCEAYLKVKKVNSLSLARKKRKSHSYSSSLSSSSYWTEEDFNPLPQIIQRRVARR